MGIGEGMESIWRGTDFFLYLCILYLNAIMKKFFRSILLVLNVLVVVAMLVSTLAGVIPPSRIVWVSILSYGYFLLLLANLLFIIVWLCLSRWEFLISAAAIAIRYAFVPLFFQVGGTMKVEPGEHTLKVMSFNAHSFTGLDEDTLMTRDSGAVIFLHLLDEERPDVMCLQECYTGGKVNMLDSLVARGYKYYAGVHGQNTRSPLVLYSLHPIINLNTMDKASKLYADIVKNGHPVRICCVHLDSYQLDESDLKGFEQLTHAQYDDTTTHKILRKFKETVRCHETEWREELEPLVSSTRIPMILAGDFNDTPASYIYQSATRLLRDSYVEQGRGFGTTYHGPYPAFRIDYILHSDNIEALSYRRLKTNVSDHYPIVVQFNLAPEPKDD